MQSDKMSHKVRLKQFEFFAQLHLASLISHLAGNLMKIGQFVPQTQAVEGVQNSRKKKDSPSFGYISKSIFVVRLILLDE